MANDHESATPEKPAWSPSQRERPSRNWDRWKTRVCARAGTNHPPHRTSPPSTPIGASPAPLAPIG